MGCEVVFTETYRDELQAIVAYLKDTLGSPLAAAKLLDSLDRMIDLLAEMPELKSVSKKPSFGEQQLREWFTQSYVVVYRIDDSTVYFEHVFHQSQDYASLV